MPLPHLTGLCPIVIVVEDWKRKEMERKRWRRRDGERGRKKGENYRITPNQSGYDVKTISGDHSSGKNCILCSLSHSFFSLFLSHSDSVVLSDSVSFRWEDFLVMKKINAAASLYSANLLSLVKGKSLLFFLYLIWTSIFHDSPTHLSSFLSSSSSTSLLSPLSSSTPSIVYLELKDNMLDDTFSILSFLVSFLLP